MGFGVQIIELDAHDPNSKDCRMESSQSVFLNVVENLRYEVSNIARSNISKMFVGHIILLVNGK